MGKKMDSIAKTRRYLRRNGLKRTVSAVMERISAPKYDEFNFSPLTEEEIKNIKDYNFDNPVIYSNPVCFPNTLFSNWREMVKVPIELLFLLDIDSLVW